MGFRMADANNGKASQLVRLALSLPLYELYERKLVTFSVLILVSLATIGGLRLARGPFLPFDVLLWALPAALLVIVGIFLSLLIRDYPK